MFLRTSSVIAGLDPAVHGWPGRCPAMTVEGSVGSVFTIKSFSNIFVFPFLSSNFLFSILVFVLDPAIWNRSGIVLPRNRAVTRCGQGSLAQSAVARPRAAADRGPAGF
jgi:hypothetical protein